VGVKACKHEDSTIGQLAAEIFKEIQAIAPRHHKIAEEQIGPELPSAEEAFVGGVTGPRLVASLFEDQGKSVGNHGVVVDD